MAEVVAETAEISTTGLTCPICEKGCSGGQLVKKVDKELFKKLKTSVSTRVELGEIQWLPLKTFLQDADWQKTSYHSKCRKELCNTNKISRLRKRSENNPN